MSARGFYTKGGKKRPITPRQGDFPQGRPKKTLSPLREKHYTSVRPDPPRDAPSSNEPDGGYNGWSNHDTWNTKLLLDNDEPSYRQEQAAAKNFLRKDKAGTYDRDAARYYVLKYLVPLARKQDPEINPNKVNLGEIADVMLRDAKENERYEQVELARKRVDAHRAEPGDYKLLNPEGK